ncbi:hypothetical protein [Trichothermofontia sp.]
MEPTAKSPDQIVIAEVNTTLKRLLKHWGNVKKAQQSWDFKSSDQVLSAFTADLQQLVQAWPESRQTLQSAIAQDQAFVQSDQYPAAIADAFAAVDVPLQGEFPTYEFPPFKLTFSPENGYVRLSIGRQAQQTRLFAPDVLAAWVAVQYKRVVNSNFNADRFCRDLISAYEVVNRLALQKPDVVWGHPVPLKDIYKLLTLKQSSRQDYPESLFTYDLTRLKEQVDISYHHYRFELVPSRNATKGLLLRNSKGQESRVDALIIYANDDTD